MTQEKTLARLQWEQAVQNDDFAQADKLFFKLKDKDEEDLEFNLSGVKSVVSHEAENDDLDALLGGIAD